MRRGTSLGYQTSCRSHPENLGLLRGSSRAADISQGMLGAALGQHEHLGAGLRDLFGRFPASPGEP